MTPGTNDGRVVAPGLLHAQHRYLKISYAPLIVGFVLVPLVQAISAAP